MGLRFKLNFLACKGWTRFQVFERGGSSYSAGNGPCREHGGDFGEGAGDYSWIDGCVDGGLVSASFSSFAVMDDGTLVRVLVGCRVVYAAKGFRDKQMYLSFLGYGGTRLVWPLIFTWVFLLVSVLNS